MVALGDLEELFDAAARCGVPPQNILAAARDGRIGWSIMGVIPRRYGFADVWEATMPQSWADGRRGWDDWLLPADYPRVILPPAGRLWSANNRAVDGEMLRALGDGGYDLGARASSDRHRSSNSAGTLSWRRKVTLCTTGAASK